MGSGAQLRRVLIVEDSTDLRILFERALNTEETQAIAVSSGLEALLWLDQESHLPELILLDISMPQMTGEDFMRNLKRRPRLAHIDVLLVSGWDQLAKRAKDLGAVGYIQKPVDLTRLIRVVEKFLNEKAEKASSGP